MLTFVRGDVIWPDRFELVGTSRGLARVARLVRDFHDAVEGFSAPVDAHWQVLIPADGADIIAHHDLAPWNLVADGEDAWAFIDWDTAGPGTAPWDVAYAMRGFVQLSGHPHWQRADADSRLRVFADAYGLGESERRELVPLLGRRTRAMHDFLRAQAAQGNQPWATLWAEGHGDAWRSDAEYIEQREELWARALLDG